MRIPVEKNENKEKGRKSQTKLWDINGIQEI